MGVHHPGWGGAPPFLSPEEPFFAGVVRTVSLTWRTRTLQPVSLLPLQDSALLAPAVVFTLQSVLGRQTPVLNLGPSVSCLGPGLTASRVLSGDMAGRQQLQGSGGK